MVKQRMLEQVQTSEEYFIRSTRELVEADSEFAPQPGMFSVAGQVAHVAQTIDWFVGGAFAEAGFDLDFERMDREVRATRSLTEARDWFAKAVSAARAAIETHTEEEWQSPLPAGPIMGGMPRMFIFSALVDHTAHHRGALTVYTRLLGKVSPMPYGDM